MANENQNQNQNQNQKNDYNKGLASLKESFAELGNLSTKLKSAKSAPEKADVRNKHRYGLDKLIKAVKVFKTNILKDKEMKVFASLLTWERQRGLISVADNYALNRMEFETLEEDTCECFQTAPSGLLCELGGQYKHKTYFDEARQKDMYITYIPVTIEPESQIGKKLEWKMKQGFMPEMKDYPQEKILIHRRLLVDSEWKRYFRELA